MKNGSFLGLVISLALICSLFVVRAALADGIVKVTQMDASNFPEITIYVSVTDEHGQPVNGLAEDEFQLTEDGKPVAIEAFAGEGEGRPVDIVFVFDTTGSMEDQIEGVKQTSITFANELRDRNRDFRLGLVAFGDEIREVRNSDDTLTADAEEFKGWISRLNADGGDDGPELALDALERATQMSYRDNTQKVLILITDAPPHYRGDGTDFSQVLAEEVEAQLREQGFTLYAVAVDDPDYHELVNETSGEFYDIYLESDFTGIIEKIGGLIASQYRLTYISARPSHDGTRRHIEVTVGEATGTSTYLEQHLVNIRSNGFIALLLFLPLLMALLLPTAIKRRSQSGTNLTDQPIGEPAEPMTDATPPSHSAPPSQCPHCDNPLRLGAKFCAGCGQAVTTPQAHPATCSACSKPLKPGAKFCAQCGVRV